HRLGIEAIRALHQAIEGEHVTDVGLLLQADEHVVAEQQAIADLDDVTGGAVVLGTDANPPDDLHMAAAELGQALTVEAFGQITQAMALLLQALVQHLIGTALGHGLVQYVLCLCVRHRVLPGSTALGSPPHSWGRKRSKRSTASPAGAPRALPRAGALQRGLGERETV